MTHTPHDALFRAAFEAPEHVAQLLGGILPPALAGCVVWDSLTRESASFIGPQLEDRRGDLCACSATSRGSGIVIASC